MSPDTTVLRNTTMRWTAGVGYLLAPAAVLIAIAKVASWLPTDRRQQAAVGLEIISVGAASFALWRSRRRQRVKSESDGVRQEARRQTPTWFYLIEGVAVAATAAAALWPVSKLASHYYGYPGDGQAWLWLAWRMGRQLGHGDLLPLRFTDVAVPFGVDLRLGDGYLPLYVGGLWNLIVGPTLAYNLSLLTAMATSTLAARRLALTCAPGRRGIALLCACSYGTAPLLTLRLLGHFNLIFTFALPLLLAVAVRAIRDGPGSIRPIRLAALLVLAYLSSIYYLLFGFIAVNVALLVTLPRLPRRQALQIVVRLGAATFIAGLVLLTFLVPRLRYERAEREAGAPQQLVPTYEYEYYSADVRSVFTPPADSIVGVPWGASVRRTMSPNPLEATVFPGLAALLALAWLAVTRHPLRQPLLLAAAAVWVLCLGPTLVLGGSGSGANWKPEAILQDHGIAIPWLPYQALTALPGLSSLRTPNRAAALLPAVAVAALAAVLSNTPQRSRSDPARIVPIVLILLLLVPSIRAGEYWSDDGVGPAIEQALRRIAASDPRQRLLIVPQDCVQAAPAARLQMFGALPIVGCPWFSSGTPWYSQLQPYAASAAWASLRCDPTRFGVRPTDLHGDPAIPEARDAGMLREQLGVGVIVFSKRSGCEAARTAEIEAALRSSGRVVAEDQDWVVFDVRDATS